MDKSHAHLLYISPSGPIESHFRHLHLWMPSHYFRLVYLFRPFRLLPLESASDKHQQLALTLLSCFGIARTKASSIQYDHEMPGPPGPEGTLWQILLNGNRIGLVTSETPVGEMDRVVRNSSYERRIQREIR